MAIIYSYPQIGTTDITGEDLMIISDMSKDGKPTKSIKLTDLATFITDTGTGSGTTNKITKWTDGASGLLGDSSITDAGGQVSMSTNFTVSNPTEISGGYAKLTTDWGDHRISILDTLGAYTFTAVDLDGGGKIGINKQNPSTTLHVGGTGTFDSSLSIPLIPTANAHATSKQYVDQQIASIPAGLVFQGNWNASTNTPTLASGTGTVGNYYVVSVAGNTNLDGITDWEVGDWAVFVEVGGVDKWDKIDQTFVQGAGATGQVSFWNGVNSVTGDNDFYWDNSNKRLGIGTTIPGVKLDVLGSGGIRTATNSGALAAGYFALMRSDYGANALRLTSRAGDVFRATDFGQAVSILTGTTASGTSERLYINSSGNVGIGTSNPSKKLEIKTTATNDGLVFSTGTPDNLNYANVFNSNSNAFPVGNISLSYGSSSTALINAQSNSMLLRGGSNATGYIRFNSFTTEVMRMTDVGLGIGTTSPGYDLHVKKASGAANITIEGSTNSGANFSSRLNFSNKDTSGNDIDFTIGLKKTNNFVFMGDAAANEVMRIEGNTGNVGIGTTSPQAALHVSGPFNTNAPTGNGILMGLYNNTHGYIHLNGSSGGYIDFSTSGVDHKGRILYNNSSNYFRFDTDGTEKVRITSIGNVGIGTTSPAEKLSLPDNAKIGLGDSGDLLIFHDATNSQIFNKVGDLVIRNDQNDGDIEFLCDDGSGGTTEYFRLDGSSTSMQASKNIVFADSIRAVFGGGADMAMYHNSASQNGIIENFTNDLIIQNNADDEDIVFKCDDGSGGVAEYFRVDGSSEITIASKDFQFQDNVRSKFGNAGDLEIYHNGTNNLIDNINGDISIRQLANDKDIRFRCDDGSGGETEYFRVDGGDVRTIVSKPFRFIDSIAVEFGTGLDMQLYHSGGEGTFFNYTGNLRFIQGQDDGDITFSSDDGSGGVTEYFRLDGAATTTVVSKPFRFQDNVKAKFGAGSDLQIYHDGNNSFISDLGTGNLNVQGSIVAIESPSGENYFVGVENAYSAIYHNGNKKLETTSTGTKTTGQMDLAFLNTPVTNSDDNGNVGEIRFTSDYIYVCVADDTWKRVALSTW